MNSIQFGKKALNARIAGPWSPNPWIIYPLEGPRARRVLEAIAQPARSSVAALKSEAVEHEEIDSVLA